MAVTQIVSLNANKEMLQKSLQKMSTEKIVFLTTKERIKDVLSIRNEFALSYKLPTEVKTVGNSTKELFAELKKHKNAIVHIIDYDELNYYLLSASFLLGIPVYFSDGQGMQQLPGLASRLKDMLSPDQLKIMENLKKNSTHEELAFGTKLDNSLLFYYLYGKNSHSGLVKLGLVSDGNDKLSLTELGKLVVDS